MKQWFLLLLLLLLLCHCATIEKKENASKSAGTKISVVPQKRFLKRKVAIARFSNETQYGRSFFSSKKNKNSRKQTVDILSSKLAATGKFLLVERSDIDKIIDEAILRLQKNTAESFQEDKNHKNEKNSDNEDVKILSGGKFIDKNKLSENNHEESEKDKKKRGKGKEKYKDNNLLEPEFFYKGLVISPYMKNLFSVITEDFRSRILVDYLIFGSVSEFGRKTTGEVGIFTRTKRQTANAAVNIRLVDAYTGEITYSEEAESEAFSEVSSIMGIGGRAGSDSSINDKAISSAISKLVENIVAHLLNEQWQAYILGHKDGVYIMSGGKSQGVRKGDVFGVYIRGKKVKNPQTDMFIELPGKLTGKIKVESLAGAGINNEVSLCSGIGGNIPVDNFSDLYIRELDKENN